MHSKLRPLLLAFLIIPILSYADFSPRDWQLVRDIITTPASQGTNSGETLIRVDVPTSLIRKTRSGFQDVRVVDGGGVERPSEVRAVLGNTTYISRTVSFYDLGKKGDTTTFIADFGAKPNPHSRITISSPAVNFRKIATLEGSDDRGSALWSNIASGVAVYDYSREFHARDVQLEYPKTVYRYVRVSLKDDDTGAALPIRGIEGDYTEITTSERANYEPQVKESQIGVEKKSSYILDLNQRGLPIDTIVLTTPTENFERFVSVYAGVDRQQFHLISSDIIFRLSGGNTFREKLAIHIPRTQDRYYRIEISNADSPPIVVTSWNMLGDTQALYFYGVIGQMYKLYYGNQNANAPTYDIGNLLNQANLSVAARGSLGDEQGNVSFLAPILVIPKIPLDKQYPWALPSVFTLAIIVIGGLAYRAAKGMQKRS